MKGGPPTRSRRSWRGAAPLTLLLALVLTVAGCGEDSEEDPALGGAAGQLAATHVHSLAIEPDTGALLIATHDGLFELDDQALERVGDLRDDLMGFTVADSSTYVASGHPAPPEAGQSPQLGLISSGDGGESWEPVSLQGRADFHALDAQGPRIYGYNGASSELLRSEDGGKSWEATDQLGPVVDLAIDPTDEDRLIAATEEGLFSSEDGGDSWDSFQGPPGLLSWTSAGIYLIDAYGKVLSSADGETLEPVGRTGQLAVAMTGGGDDDQLFIATDRGEILESSDGGSSWAPVSLS